MSQVNYRPPIVYIIYVIGSGGPFGGVAFLTRKGPFVPQHPE